ncbi:DUF2281 domain-containing protein [Spirulina sp. 06S082]|uniref:DUF2281 domain-containing protein n=1 Tax=Spirulina sp. 06S082 TaxID=3110248 RepID=UPI002B201F06|nr:DUF2281 domain-containing protein [Spirulina sp. 06S082]MEA5471202.1 DUF2281 domain-containing protein [Spirulina sp. 06S082]
MTLEQAVLATLRELPPHKQQEVLDFAQYLQQKEVLQRPHPSLMGLWADLDIHITEEDITEARKEMWGNFPREIDL